MDRLEALAAIVQEKIKLIPDKVRLSRGEILSLLNMPIAIPLKPCVSSNVSAFGFDKDSGTAAVKFVNGTEYRYLNVPAKMLSDLENSESKGRVVSIMRQMIVAVKVEPSFYSRLSVISKALNEASNEKAGQGV